MKIASILCLLAFLGVPVHAGPATQPVDVWLDVDTTNGLVDSRPRDVDDGLAILFALHSPEVTVRGVSVCFGNGRLDQTLPITQDLLARFAPDVLKVPYSGAKSSSDLGTETDATRALAAELQRRPLVVLALGPVTNIASVVTNHPDFKQRIRQIVVVAGRRPDFGFHPPGRRDLVFPDANFEKDPQGMQLLLDSGIPIVLAGYEVSSDVWITRADMQTLAGENACGSWIAETSEAWLTRWEKQYKLKGFNPFDTLAVGCAIDPNLTDSISVTARIETRPDDRATPDERAAGKTKPYLICEPTSQHSSLIYCTEAKPAFATLLLNRLAGTSHRR